ncbi:MAG: PAS domain S-box protein [Thermodesulfovibrionales bacterium]
MQDRQKTIPYHLLAIFFLLSFSIAITGYLYYKNQKEHIKKEKHEELNAIADLKVDQIRDWREERFRDASFIYNNPQIARQIKESLEYPGSPALKKEVPGWMTSMYKNRQYKSMCIIDRNGKIIVSVHEDNAGKRSRVSNYLNEALKTKKVFFSDLYRDEVKNIFMDIVVPIIFSQNNEEAPVGFVVLRIDPYQFLYPLIHSYPVPSKTAESLLVRKEGSEVVYLNELRHRKNMAFNLRLPSAQTDLPAVMAVFGKEGVVEGKDYRGIPVLAAIKKIPGSPWFLVAKVDMEEVFAPHYNRFRLITILVWVLIVLSGTAVIMFWRHQQAQFYKKQYDGEFQRITLLQKYEHLTKLANDIVLLVDEQGRIVEANDMALITYGYELNEILALNIRDLRTPEARSEIASLMKTVEERNGLIFETLHMKKDGAIFPVEVSSRVITIAEQKLFMSIIRDISERKQTEEALKKSEELYRSLFENMLNGFAYCKMLFEEGRPKDFIYLAVNSAFEMQTGLKNVIGKKVSEVIPGIRDSDPQLLEIYGRVALTGLPERFETYVNALGMWFWISVYSPVHEHFVAVFDVITERKRAEEELRKLYRAVEQSPASVIITDLHGDIEYVNPKFTEVTGYSLEEVRGKNPRILKSGETPPEEYRRLWETITSGGEWHGMFHNKRKDGALFWERVSISAVRDNSGAITHFIAVNEDITNRKCLEDQFRQAQKMEAVGQLAGGIAHDFNNILTAIIGYGHIIKMKLKEDNPLRTYADRILSLSDRAANLTQSLLSFSRKRIMNPEPVNLNEVVKRIDHLLSRIIGEDIRLQTTLSEEEMIVMADSEQIELVLMNLATNARDAMPEGGLLNIGTEKIDIDEEFIKEHGFGRKGEHVLISVADTGAGIDIETREKIFEPFFTTKEVGKGTGLGLSMVYGIIKQHEGYINIYSEPGMGTTFRIYLPLIEAKVEEIKPEVIQPFEIATETVLLAEDETEVREFTKKLLEEYGYKVITASSGQEAINEFKAHKDKIQLVLLDVMMPDKNGREAYDEIKKIRPDIKVLFMSGYPADTIHKHKIIEKGFAYIEKPASPTKLLKKIREVLGQ